jgi:SAM-dependent methyltransferase
MRREYWDSLAKRFDNEIFDVLGDSANGELARQLHGLAHPHHSVVDIGCGTGRHLRLLVHHFSSVAGIEQSEACLQIARAACDDVNRVLLVRATWPPRWMHSAFDVAVSFNCAIHPHRRRWGRALDAVSTVLRTGGRALVVVPSSESAQQLYRYARGSEHFPERPDSHGVAAVGGTRTRHFFREELLDALQARGLERVRITKNEYTWASHGLRASDAVRRPWDWVAAAVLR